MSLTRERLLKIKTWRETYGPGSNVVLPAEEAEDLARIALASLEAEPVISININDGWPEPNSAAPVVGAERLSNGVHELYTASPVPVVPEEMPKGLAGQIVSLLAHNIGDKSLARKIWNACRAAMLNAESVSQPYTLPENVRNALSQALQAMEFMGDTLNNLDALCMDDVEFVRPAFETIRKVLAAAPQKQ